MSAPHTTGSLVVVTKEEFFAYVGPRDIRPRAEREYSAWETPSRELIGKTTPGYANTWSPGGFAPEVYMLTEAASDAIAKATTGEQP